MGIELKKWPVYSEPAHLSVSTPEHSPDAARVAEMNRQMGIDMINTMMEVRENPRPGLVNALLQLRIDGEPAPDLEILGNLGLIIGGGFDTTTALTSVRSNRTHSGTGYDSPPVSPTGAASTSSMAYFWAASAGMAGAISPRRASWRSAATAMFSASTWKCRRNAWRVSDMPNPSVPSEV